MYDLIKKSQKPLLAVFSILILLSLIGLMSVFNASPQRDVIELLKILSALLIPCTLLILFPIICQARTDGLASTLKNFWRQCPNWLKFAWVLLNSLVLSGELAFLLVKTYSQQNSSWLDHAPLISCLAATTAFVVWYVFELVDKETQLT